MNFINEKIDNDINAIIFYYARKNKIKELREKMTQKYNQISELSKEIKRIESQITEEVEGKHELKYVFKYVNGKNDLVEESVKTKTGSLENLGEFINEATEKEAIDKYLKSIGIKLYGGELSEYSKLVKYTP